MRVLSVFGTRPEAIKMAPVVQELASRRGIKSKVCVTAQHRQMLDQVLKLFNISPDYDLNLMAVNQSLAHITGAVINGVDDILKKEKFDWILVQGDTTTCMAASLAGFYNKANIGHVEAGLRTSDRYQPFPEEINRRICDMVADAYFAPTQWAADNLLKENVDPGLVYVTGNTVIDALLTVADKEFSFSGGPLAALPDDKKIILVTAHRRENFGKPIRQICQAILKLANDFNDIHFVYPVHLNPNIKGPVFELLGRSPRVTLTKPLDYLNLVKLMQRAYFVLTDSGGIQEEAPGLGKPVLVLRNSTERPEGLEAGTVKLASADTELVYQACVKLLSDQNEYQAMAQAVNPYGDGKSAKYIVDTLLFGGHRGDK